MCPGARPDLSKLITGGEEVEFVIGLNTGKRANVLAKQARSNNSPNAEQASLTVVLQLEGNL